MRDLLQPRFQRFNQLPAISIFLFGLCLSSLTLMFDYLGVDDSTHLLKNPHLLSWTSLLGLWTKPYFGLYIPLTYTVWGSVALIFGKTPLVFHGLNVFFHSLNGVLVYFFSRKYFENKWAPVFSALVFIAHPLQASSVAWISEFRGILGTTWALCFLIFLQKTLSDTKMNKKAHSIVLQESRIFLPGFRLLVLFFFLLCALFSKVNFVILPVIGLLLIGYENKFSFRQAHAIQIQKKTILILLTMTGAGLFSVIQTQTWQNSPTQQISYVGKAILVLNNFGFYLNKIVVPINLHFDYGFSLQKMTEPQYFLFWTFVAIAVAALLHFLSKKRELTLWFMLFLLALLPVLGLTKFAYQHYNTVADRYVYFSMIFFSLMLSQFVCEYSKNIRATFIVMGMMVLSFYVPLFFVNAFQYKNTFALAESTLQNFPESFVAYTIRGQAHFANADFAAAENDYRKAIELKPENWVAHSQLGELLETQKRWQESLDHFTEIVENRRGLYKEIGSDNLTEFFLRIDLAKRNLTK